MNAVVVGTVVDGQDQGVSGVVLSALVKRAGCDSSEDPGGFPTFQMDGAGAFTGNLGIPLTAPFRGCVTLEGVPPEGSDLGSATVSGIEIDFVRGVPVDAARVTIVLKPAGPD